MKLKYFRIVASGKPIPPGYVMSLSAYIIYFQVQDAYEEVEEQRTVAAQWKRKLQKLTNDMADLRSLLDEQVNCLLTICQSMEL